MKNWRIVTLGQTEIVLHSSLLLYAGYACLCGKAGPFVASVLSILLHEGAHALVGALLGQSPERIELTPLGAVLRVEDEAKLSPAKRLLMLLAGSGMNLLVCSISVWLTHSGLLNAAWGSMMFVCNLSMIAINLLPALPLDGGRILLLLLEFLFPERMAHRILQGFSTCIGLGLIALNLYISGQQGGWNLSLAFAGCCLLYSSSVSLTTKAMTEYRFLLDRKILLEHKGCLRMSAYAVLHTQTLRQVVRMLPERRVCLFLCYEAGSMRLMGMLTETELLQQYFDAPERTAAQAISNTKGQNVHCKIDTI